MVDVPPVVLLVLLAGVLAGIAAEKTKAGVKKLGTDLKKVGSKLIPHRKK